jgi:hypothetical protein
MLFWFLEAPFYLNTTTFRSKLEFKIYFAEQKLKLKKTSHCLFKGPSRRRPIYHNQGPSKTAILVLGVVVNSGDKSLKILQIFISVPSSVD